MKTLFLLGFTAALLMLSAAQAQQTVSNWGATPEDSIRCRQNLSFLQTSVQAGDFERALGPWTVAFETCPASSVNIYVFGSQIFRHLHAQETDPAKRQAHVDKVMMLYDRRMELFPHLQPRGTVIAAKTTAYMNMMGDQANQATIRQWLGEAIDEMREGMAPSLAYWHFMAASLHQLQTNNISREQYIEDYFRIIGYLEQAIANASDEAIVAHLQALSDGITGQFLSSGAGDCDTIAALYADRVAANSTDLELLNEVLSILSQLNCRESDLFFTVSGYIHAVSPTANSALGMANRARRDGDTAAAMRYFRQAAELEDDNVRASEIMMQIASILSGQRNWSAARAAAQEALRFNSGNGAAHILIAQVIASGSAGIFTDGRTGLVFGAAIDQLERARAVDPSVAAQANNLIRQYTAHLMDAETAFMMGIRAGEQIHIPGWINVTTTVRLR